MTSNLNYVIEQVGKDKGIDRKVIIEALEQAVLTASRKKYGHQGEIEVEGGVFQIPLSNVAKANLEIDQDMLRKEHLIK